MNYMSCLIASNVHLNISWSCVSFVVGSIRVHELFFRLRKKNEIRGLVQDFMETWEQSFLKNCPCFDCFFFRKFPILGVKLDRVLQVFSGIFSTSHCTFGRLLERRKISFWDLNDCQKPCLPCRQQSKNREFPHSVLRS